MSSVFVLLNTEPSQMENVLENIKKIEGVEEAYMFYGVYDICAKVTTKLQKDLKVIVQKIRAQNNVLTPLTLLMVKE